MGRCHLEQRQLEATGESAREGEKKDDRSLIGPPVSEQSRGPMGGGRSHEARSHP